MNKSNVNIIIFIIISAIILFGVLPNLREKNNLNNSNQEKQNSDNIDNSDSLNDLNQESKLNMKVLEKPQMLIDKSKKYMATLETSKGNIVIELFADKTPITVNNFVYLANNQYYDNTPFHRVIKGFMIQGGDPTGTGSGGPGYSFEDEVFEGEYTRGTIAMANAGPDTNGSQFFIMHQDNPLPKNYVIFGKVTEGIEIVDDIANSEVKNNFMGEMSSPVESIQIKTVTISEK